MRKIHLFPESIAKTLMEIIVKIKVWKARAWGTHRGIWFFFHQIQQRWLRSCKIVEDLETVKSTCNIWVLKDSCVKVLILRRFCLQWNLREKELSGESQKEYLSKVTVGLWILVCLLYLQAMKWMVLFCHMLLPWCAALPKAQSNSVDQS